MATCRRLTDRSPRRVPFGLLDLGFQVAQRDGEFIVDFLGNPSQA